MARTGARRNPPMGGPVTSRPTNTASPARTSGDHTQGVLIDLETNLGGGIYAELNQSYREAVKLLTRAIEDERGDVIKLALARRFRGLACTDPVFRNGKEAVERASRACQLDKWKDADQIDTLAAAHAEAGNFAEAERYQLKGLSLLSADEALRPKFQARLKQYRAKQPVRQEIGKG